MKVFFYELFYYMKVYKRWWLAPMLVVILLLGGLVAISQTAPIISPFIYTLF
jgi:hypothetical protein